MHKIYNRRSFLENSAKSLLAILGATSTQAAIPVELTDPYTRISNPLEQDAKIVRYFFLSTCPHCQIFHGPVTRWGVTLPKDMRFIPTPVVTASRASYISAICYYAAFYAAPKHIDEYVKQAYSVFVSRPEKADDLNFYVNIIKALGIDVKVFATYAKSQNIKKLAQEAGALLAHYAIRNTPAVSVGGRYVFTPEVINGELDQFIALANAVVSQHLQDR